MRLWRSGIGLSLLVHALVVCGLMRAIWHAPQHPATPLLLGEIVWLATPPPQAAPEDRLAPAGLATEPVEGARVGDAPAARRSRLATRVPRETAIAPPAPSPGERTAAPSRPSAADLAEARQRATAGALEDGARADARRSFSFPGTIAQQRAFDESERLRHRERGLGPPLTVFDSPAKGRAALPEERTGPFGVHWVSDDCYVFREPLDRFILPGSFIEPSTCTRRSGRTDLFVTAKPSYLMHDEERAAVDAETRRREALRRPTTGAVMPPEKD